MKRSSVLALAYAVVGLLAIVALVSPAPVAQQLHRTLSSPRMDAALVLVLGLAGTFELVRALRAAVAGRLRGWMLASRTLLGLALLALGYALLPAPHDLPATSGAAQSPLMSGALALLIVACLVSARAERGRSIRVRAPEP